MKIASIRKINTPKIIGESSLPSARDVLLPIYDFSKTVTRINRFAASEKFSDVMWLKSNGSIIPNIALAPDGTRTADKWVEANNNAIHQIYQGPVYTPGKQTISFILKAGERNIVGIDLWSSSEGALASARFQLSGSGSVVAGSGTISLYPGTEDWYVCTIVGITSGTTPKAYIYTYNVTKTYQGDGVSGFYLWRAQWDEGDATEYQATPPRAYSTAFSQIGYCPITSISNEPTFSWANDKAYSITNGRLNFEVQLGGQYDNPGIWFPIPIDVRDMSNYSCFVWDIKNESDIPVLFYMTYNDEISGTFGPSAYSDMVYLEAGEQKYFYSYPLRVRYNINNKVRPYLTGMHTAPGWALLSGNTRCVKMGDMRSLGLFTKRNQEVGEPIKFSVGSVNLAKKVSKPNLIIPNPMFPFVDKYGQYKHENYPGKVSNDEMLLTQLDEETVYINANSKPNVWNDYGSWKNGPTLEATGHFRTEQYNGKWYLVDPVGKLFFSTGVTGVLSTSSISIVGREAYFEGLIDNPSSYDFYNSNIQKKYGADWIVKHKDISSKRLFSWGLNTMAAFGIYDYYASSTIPYTVSVSPYWWSTPPAIKDTSFKDVFDSRYKTSVATYLNTYYSFTINDPKCIGFFIDNELHWGQNDLYYLAKATLTGSATLAAKIELKNDLENKYTTINALNTAWNTSYVSWEALLANTTAPTYTEAILGDLLIFNRKIIRKYFELSREIVKDFAPNKLYLGTRFSTNVNIDAVDIAQEYCDVVSFNVYRALPNENHYYFKHVTNKPIIIGEFHTGAIDRGGIGVGVSFPVRTQEERAHYYKNYVTTCLRNPKVVGCHWFQYKDEPIAGRSSDGENFQIGWVSQTDYPYWELVRAGRDIGHTMYKIRNEA